MGAFYLIFKWYISLLGSNFKLLGTKLKVYRPRQIICKKIIKVRKATLNKCFKFSINVYSFTFVIRQLLKCAEIHELIVIPLLNNTILCRQLNTVTVKSLSEIVCRSTYLF